MNKDHLKHTVYLRDIVEIYKLSEFEYLRERLCSCFPKVHIHTFFWWRERSGEHVVCFTLWDHKCKGGAHKNDDDKNDTILE